jgi:SAM-dependent methyltransferase
LIMTDLIDVSEKIARGFLSRLKRTFQNFRDTTYLKDYLNSDRRPWRRGYSIYRNQCLERILSDSALLAIFSTTRSLPENYGYRLDARIVEIPWVLSQLNDRKEAILDAGSSLNNEATINAPVLSRKKITILTLAPEGVCFWNKGISYLFGDLRNLDFRDETFDVIVCVSTIEHVGMDNSLYDTKNPNAIPSGQMDFLVALKELKRVLKSGGILFCTFPFGRYENHGWFQQFDSKLTDTLIKEFNPTEYTEAIFRYYPDGWSKSTREDCSDSHFFDVRTSKYFDPESTTEYPSDFPAGERAVACLKLSK